MIAVHSSLELNAFSPSDEDLLLRDIPCFGLPKQGGCFFLKLL